MVEMDIRHERYVDIPFDFTYGAGTVHVIYRNAHDLTTGILKRQYLPDRCVSVPRIRIGHGLDAYRRAAADGHIPHPYATRLFHFRLPSKHRANIVERQYDDKREQ
jgi:hypothetical protein